MLSTTIESIIKEEVMMTDKERIRQLEKENEELKKELETERDSHSDAWDFHWDGRGSYEEARRCFYGDFS